MTKMPPSPLALPRRGLLLAGAALAGGALLPRARAAERPLLPQPLSLASALAAAVGRRKALVVMVSLDGCPPCKLVRENYLSPLLREGQPIVEIDMLGAAALAGFDGGASTPRELTRGWNVQIAPTVLFFGRGGREVAPRLAGVASPDFYGAYLDERIAAANRAMA